MVSPRKNRFPLIKYTARDFRAIKTMLKEHRRRYYSEVSRDDNEASFDEMMEDLVAIVGDQLSYFSDYNVNESFLPTAVEFDNVLKHGETSGYRFRGNPSSQGEGTFYAVIPANATGLGPDSRYLFTLKKGSEFASTSGVGFILNEDVLFGDPNNETRVARVDETTGIPTAYVVKAQGQVISGRLVEEIIEVGEFQRFLKIRLSGRDIAEILSVDDEEGKEYFEVDYLSQDVVFMPIKNRGSDSDVVPSLLKPFVVPRRFTTKRERVDTFLQFGFGSDTDESSDSLIDPATVVLNIFGKNHITDATFDPTNLLGTDKLGIAPANTSLRVIYRVNSSDNVNAAPDSITDAVGPLLEFENIQTLDPELVRSVAESFEVTNESHIRGDVTTPTVDELKVRIFDVFGAQNRAITPTDYKAFSYQMPPKFGAIKRVSVVPDPDSFKRNLNMYVLSEAADGSLITASQTIKQNLKNWLLFGKPVNDTVDIIDAKIVNIGIDFSAVGELETNKFEILNRANAALRNEYQFVGDIGEPFSITRIYNVLEKVDGIVDVTRVRIFVKRGGSYSDTRFDIDQAISPDGRFIDVPLNVILEVKLPDQDVRGSIV